MANDNMYTDMTNNEMMTERQLSNGAEQMTQMTINRPDGTPDPQDQDTFAEILTANIGAYVLIQFLIGSTSLVDKEGYLYAVGQNFVTIYEPLDDRYVVCDLYSVKFVTIYNTTPQGNTPRMNNQMSYQNNNARYQRNYTQNNRRAY